MTLEEILEDAKRIISKRIYHKDYKRTVELKTKYYRVATGDEHEELLVKFVRREDQEAFEQRVAITRTISPSVLSTATAPFNKVPRSDSLTDKCIFEDDEDDNKADELAKFKKVFHGDESLTEYFEDSFLRFNHLDPNMFIVIEFDEFDPNFETPSPRPFEVPSDRVFNFNYLNNDLQYLIAHEMVIDPLDAGIKDHEVFTVYGKEEAVTFTEVDKEFADGLILEEGEITTGINAQGETKSYFKIKDGAKVYLVEVFEHGSGFVPAFRVGYIKDLQTDGRTYVSTWHSSMPYFDKMIKTVSELDLSMTLHAHPQKISYQQPCPGPSINERCSSGRLANGGICGSCGGSGFVSTSTTTAQDEIKLRMPRTDKDEAFIDISKLIAYITPDIETVKFLSEYVEKMEQKVRKAIFNSDSFDRDTIVKTATEDNNDLDNIYDALHLFANNYSKRFRFATTAIATFVGLENGLQVIHKFGNDFKLESKNQLIQRWINLNESNAPSFLKKETGKDIARMVYADDPEELLKYQVKDRFMPFHGKSETEIVFLISNANTRDEDKVLYANFESIFDDLEFETEGFYQKDEKEQRDLVKEKVSELIESNRANQPEPIPFNEEPQP